MLTFRRVSFSVLCWSILSSKWSPFGAPFWYHFDHFGRTFFNMFPDTLKASKRVPKRYPKWSLLGSFFGVCSERARHRFLMTPPMKIHDFRRREALKKHSKSDPKRSPPKGTPKRCENRRKGALLGTLWAPLCLPKGVSKNDPKKSTLL